VITGMRSLLRPLMWSIVALNIVLSVVLVVRVAETASAAEDAGMLALSELKPADRELARGILRSRMGLQSESLSAVDAANRAVIDAFAARPFDAERAEAAAERLLTARADLWRRAATTYIDVFEALPPDGQDVLVAQARERRARVFSQ
jgi:Spy/CpxP family protein refolding chaperone